MSRFVIDAGIAIKWVVEEDGTAEAVVLRQQAMLIAPELLVPECANILWKKVQRHELSKQEALLAARLLEVAEIELVPTRSLLEVATRIALDLDHPAYGCLYLALAVAGDCPFVTADERFRRKLVRARPEYFGNRVISLVDAAAGAADGKLDHREARPQVEGDALPAARAHPAKRP